MAMIADKLKENLGHENPLKAGELESRALENLYEGEVFEGYRTLCMIEEPEPQQREALAILAFDLGLYDKVTEFMDGRIPGSHYARFACAMSCYYSGEFSPSAVERYLEPDLDKYYANAILGVLEFNSGNYATARSYFEAADRLKSNQYDLEYAIMRCDHFLGNDADVNTLTGKYRRGIEPFELEISLSQKYMDMFEFRVSVDLHTQVKEALDG